MFSIKILRMQKRLSQQDIADRAGISAVTVSRIETGFEQPKIETLEKIAEALGVTAAYLLEYEKTIKGG
jgi:transcriptional regulator with XRE-family HTH domain